MSRHVSLRPLLAAVVLLVSLTPVLAAEPQSGPPRDRPWKLVFADEFNGPQLGATKWSRSRNHGDAFCWNGAKGRVSEDHAAVDGHGNFVIRVTRDPDGNCFSRARPHAAHRTSNRDHRRVPGRSASLSLCARPASPWSS